MTPDSTDDRQILVNEESPEGILSELHALLSQTRTDSLLISPERLHWKYLRNPDGSAVVWTLRDSRSNELQGFTACIPRRMSVNGQVHIAWNGADFSVAPHCRTLGPALLLRRQARLQIDGGRAAFLYSHPNERMALIHQRVGHRRLGRMLRMARPLSLAPKLKAQGTFPLAHRVASVVIDPVVRAVSVLRWGRLDRISYLDPLVFDARFDELFALNVGARPIVGIRDSQYLNWRWGSDSVTPPTVIIASDDGRIVGFLVLTDYRGMLEIRDVFPSTEPEIVKRLISAALRIGLDRGHSSISITLLERNPLVEIFQKRRFLVRDHVTESFVYAPEGFRAEHSLDSPDSWYMVSGDRDV